MFTGCHIHLADNLFSSDLVIVTVTQRKSQSSNRTGKYPASSPLNRNRGKCPLQVPKYLCVQFPIIIYPSRITGPYNSLMLLLSSVTISIKLQMGYLSLVSCVTEIPHFCNFVQTRRYSLNWPKAMCALVAWFHARPVTSYFPASFTLFHFMFFNCTKFKQTKAALWCNIHRLALALSWLDKWNI